jgi:hypothetical protein
MRLAIGGRPQPDREIDVSGQGQQFTELMSFAVLP